MSTHNGCTHPASDHGRVEGVGCMVTGCDCTASRRVVQAAEDRAATATALANVEQGSDPVWVSLATDTVLNLAREGEPFTTDDVWDHLAERGVEQPREPRALGPIMKSLQRSHAIKLEGYATSRRRHGALIRSYTGA